ncbi:hypothetical protein GCM10027062_05090 [Nocardioides hungaricus]
MRRSIVAPVIAAVAVALVLSTPGSGSGSAPDTGPERTLSTAQELLARARGVGGDTADVSPAMRELFKAMPTLDAADRRTARSILARPTDGAADPLGDGYTVSSRRRCDKRVCVHWVDSTADAPPDRAWVDANLKVLGKVWRTEVGRLGYRKPVGDRRRGGNAKLDIYLKELGGRGVYGYCTPERRVPQRRWLASGYCVLDNDFAEAQYGAPPMRSLRVTAAHEFFHAVQFGYDYAEDPWLMESTATWMEERVADDADDNRRYLPYGQVGSPGRPLDTFSRQGLSQYGNWTFFEYLSSRFGVGIVRQIWSRAGAYPGAGDQYSTAAVKGALGGRRGGFVDVFRRFAAANTVPGRSYPEGGKWPAAPTAASWTLTRDAPRQSAKTRIDHMASRNYTVRPGAGVGGNRWRLRITIDGPGRRTAPAAYLVVKRKSGLTRAPIELSKRGGGRKVVPFSGQKVSWAKVVLVNASTRFSCWRRTSWSCQGRARDDDARFRLTVAAVRSRR